MQASEFAARKISRGRRCTDFRHQTRIMLIPTQFNGLRSDVQKRQTKIQAKSSLSDAKRN